MSDAKFKRGDKVGVEGTASNGPLWVEKVDEEDGMALLFLYHMRASDRFYVRPISTLYRWQD